jgi:leader peptidase (prepilin peptidase) / N-methyltransferase
MILYYIFIFILGLIAGSFLNCLIYRTEKEKSFLKGRSFCPYCGHVLSWQDLIPVISFILLRGRCRYCRERISVQYPLVELFTGSVFALIFHFRFFSVAQKEIVFSFENAVSFLFLSFVFSCLIVVFVYDLKHFIIPDKVIYPAILAALGYNAYLFLINDRLFHLFLDNIYSAVGACAFFLLVIFVSRGKGMGWGDAKLGFLMGLLLGPVNVVVALFSSFILGAIIGTGLLLLKKKKMKSELPFGPFLVTGTIIAMFWGQELANWYFNLFIQ